MDSLIRFLEVNRLLQTLSGSVREVLGEHFVGMYLDGSLAKGGFDQDSDIDFVVVTQEDITPQQFDALQAMHDRIARLNTAWAVQLEGSYLSRAAVRRFDPHSPPFPNIERGTGERLKWVQPHISWVVHRYILYKCGITLAGPAPQTLVDPVTPDELRLAVLSLCDGWLEGFLAHPENITQRGYQSYIVLTLCRMHYTLQEGGLASKPAAVEWARKNLDKRWVPLIDSAWEGRHLSDGPPLAWELEETLEMVRDTLAWCKEEWGQG